MLWKGSSRMHEVAWVLLYFSPPAKCTGLLATARPPFLNVGARWNPANSLEKRSGCVLGHLASSVARAPLYEDVG